MFSGKLYILKLIFYVLFMEFDLYQVIYAASNFDVLFIFHICKLFSRWMLVLSL